MVKFNFGSGWKCL